MSQDAEMGGGASAALSHFGDLAGEPTVPDDRPAEADGDPRAPVGEARGDRPGRRD
jgi:hypothetical protein